jgi:cellulose synthase/poly-beta-1,6-N-acetylglucosamine synthase-like glycosyltransferase
LTTAQVIIPWRGGDPDRAAAYAFVDDWTASIGLPRIAVDAEDGAPGVFHRAAAKNEGARLSAWADVLIFNDADMIIPRESYVELIDRAAESRKLVVGFFEYRTLEKATSQMVYDGQLEPFDAPAFSSHGGFSLGGVIAIRQDAFAEVGGYDERFLGWCCEDTAFAIACITVLGSPDAPYERLEGPGLHFFHEHATLYEDRNLEADNGQLLARYNNVHDVSELREVQGLPC